MTAAIYAARAGLDCVVLEMGFAGGQMATTSKVENYPGFPDGIGGADLAMAMEQQVKNLGAQIRRGTVHDVALKGKEKQVILQNGETLSCACVIIACGASPRRLDIPGERELQGMGVSYCATCDGSFFRKQEVCVVGGGDTACEDALYLSRICTRVHLIHRRDRLRAAKSLQQRVFAAENIQMHLGYLPREIQGKDGVEAILLEHAKTGERSTIPCQGVFIAAGQQPNTALFQGKIALDPGGYIVTEEDLSTDVPGVFAAGDIRQKGLRQIITAAADGALAVAAAERYLLD